MIAMTVVTSAGSDDGGNWHDQPGRNILGRVIQYQRDLCKDRCVVYVLLLVL